jgi:hypothetical protein
LGFDDSLSTDHDWGPRLMLFLHPEGFEELSTQLRSLLAEHLPVQFGGYPTNFSRPSPDDNGTRLPQPTDHGPINHLVTIHTLPGYFHRYLGVALDKPLAPADWLTLSEQRLRAATAGAVFHDGVGLESVRERLRYYPHDVWLYLLAAGWARLGEEEHLMGRAGMAGDELGSAVIGARLVRDVMRLCFLMARTYAPYPKWFGSAFQQLPGAAALSAVLPAALRAETWPDRERHLATAYEELARRHNALGLTEPMPVAVTSFHERPFKVMAFHGFTGQLLAQIKDPAVQAIAQRPPIGNINLLSDNTDLLENTAFRPALKQLYGERPDV